MKFLIGCNTLNHVNSLAYTNHMQFWYNLGKKRPEDKFLFFTPRRMSIDRMRNEAARMAMQEECDYLFFYDDDVLLPIDALDKLVEADIDVCAGLTLIRGYPFKPMAFNYKGEASVKQMTIVDDPKDLEGFDIYFCDAVGFSCCLIRVDLLKKLKPPFFVTGPYNTEDVYFCHKCKTQLSECLIGVEPSVVTGHILENHYISPGNRESFLQLEKELAEIGNYELGDDKKREDRGEKYREAVFELLRQNQTERGVWNG